MQIIFEKICTKCKITKPIDKFYSEKRANDGKTSACKECIDKTKRAYAIKNKNKLNAYKKEWEDKNTESRKRTVEKRNEKRRNNPEIAQKSAIYRASKKEEIRVKSAIYIQKNKEKIAEYLKKYNKTPAGIASRFNRKQKRRVLEKSSKISNNDVKLLLINAKVCYWCNCSLKEKQIHIDHYVPLSKGGRNEIDNLVASCSTCNLKKGATDPFIFATKIGRLL